MPKPATLIIGSACVIALAAVLGGFALWQSRSRAVPDAPALQAGAAADPSAPVATENARPSAAIPPAATPPPFPAAPQTPPAPVAVAPGDADAAAAPLDEEALMGVIHSLEGGNPTLALRLARDGNARFPDSPQAPERAWVVAKSLTDLQRFKEARAEAETTVKKYPGTSWSLDLQRHLLSNPLDD